MKTEAVRILERLAIPHTIRRFDATDLSAEEAARALDVPLDRVVKTLVVRGDRTGVMGYRRGGVSPLGGRST